MSKLFNYLNLFDGSVSLMQVYQKKFIILNIHKDPIYEVDKLKAKNQVR